MPRNDRLPDREFIARCDPALAVELPPDRRLVPVKQTGERELPARIDGNAEVADDGGCHATS